MACENGMATWAGSASLPGPCQPLGRLRSQSSDTWMPQDDGTTSISGFPRPVKSWHMDISILCVDVCIRGILHSSFTARALIEAQAIVAADSLDP